MLFKPNTVILIDSDFKKNRVYMIDVTTEKIYSHSQDFSKVDMSGATGYFGAMVILGIFEWLGPRIYLTAPWIDFKILFIVLGILMGFLMLWLVRKKIYAFPIEEYFNKYPQSEEVEDVNEVLNGALLMATIIIIASIGSFVGSIIMFNQFLNNSNIGTYIWATTLFAVFSYTTLILKHAIFILKWVFLD